MTEALRDAGHVDVPLWDTELWETVLSAHPLDDDGVERAALAAVTDVLSCSLAARHDPRLTMLLASASSDAGGVAVPGHTVRLSRPDAALIGGYQAHALDWDDVHSQVRGHPSAVLFPALWALADESTAGADFLEALAVGVEVMARLGRLAGVSHHRRGWHPTATLGPVAAAIAGARLAGLSAAATRAAAGLAASQSGGTRAQFGSPAKPLHAGLAAAAAVRSVLWAQAGITAGADPLLGPDGLACALDFESRDPSVLTAHWGQRWAISDPGSSSKDSPSVLQLPARTRQPRRSPVPGPKMAPGYWVTPDCWVTPVSRATPSSPFEYRCAPVPMPLYDSTSPRSQRRGASASNTSWDSPSAGNPPSTITSSVSMRMHVPSPDAPFACPRVPRVANLGRASTSLLQTATPGAQRSPPHGVALDVHSRPKTAVTNSKLR